MSKNNTEQTKAHLQKAISSVPADFALREVRFHLQQAAKKLEEVEKKRLAAEAKKQQVTPYQLWHERLTSNLRNSNSPQHTIDIINDMLAEEHAKLDEILERKKKKTSADDLEGEDTLLG